ncbi:hypothetical protein A6U87_28915 [Rhizobium sp. AC44/96]|jgi:hypothetical protein|nr:hypothetical protein A6U87_28915 [Rhizobium sp. AC44/96]
MQTGDILRLRQEARDALGSHGEELYQMHANAVAALSDPSKAEDVRVDALLTLRAWEDAGLFSDEHIASWRHILAMDDEEAAQAMLADTEEATALRRNTPFSKSALAYPHG